MITVSVEFEMTWRQRYRPDPRTSVEEMRASAALASAANHEAERELERAGSGILGCIQDLLERFGATPGAPPPGRLPRPGNYSESDKDSGFAIRNRGFSRFFWAARVTG